MVLVFLWLFYLPSWPSKTVQCWVTVHEVLCIDSYCLNKCCYVIQQIPQFWNCTSKDCPMIVIDLSNFCCAGVWIHKASADDDTGDQSGSLWQISNWRNVSFKSRTKRLKRLSAMHRHRGKQLQKYPRSWKGSFTMNSSLSRFDKTKIIRWRNWIMKSLCNRTYFKYCGWPEFTVFYKLILCWIWRQCKDIISTGVDH